MSTPLPPIVMIPSEHARLSDLADIVGARDPQFADDLTRELARAHLVPPDEIGPATVTMGATVEFAYRHSGARQTVTLVFPPDADIAKGRISVLTPVGTALIGLSVGQSITFDTRRGETRTITVLAVDPPER